MNKIVKLGSDARNELLKGADFIGKAVSSTLGPFGSNFFLEKGNKVTNDGVTIAKEIWLKDEVQNRGVRALQEAAARTNDEVGDGTTTAITLANAILKEAVRGLSDDSKGLIGKKTPIEIINKINSEKAEVIEKLNAMAKPITTKEELINSARVSVEDEELGKLIGETQWELGRNGRIIAEETAERRCSVERVPGIRIDNGFGTSMLINNQEKQTLEVENAQVILTNYTLRDLNPVKIIIDNLVRQGKNTIVIIARGFTPDCIRVCLENVNKGAVKIYPISAPFVDQNEVMKDLSAILGGKYIHDESERLEDMSLDDVGFAAKVTARRYDAILTGKQNDVATSLRVTERLNELEEKLKGEVSEFAKTLLENRIAQLKNGFALLKVGANSETERKYKKDKADDCVNAVRAAFQEGVVEGAGLAFKEIADGLPNDYLLKRPLNSIYEQIKFSAPKDWEVPEWVNDPVKVLRVALENACSVAGTLATASGVIATKNKPELDDIFRQMGYNESKDNE